VLKTKLLPHQQHTVDAVLKLKCIGDWSKMGTGKSLSSLASIIKVGKKAVVVCPPYLVENWLNEVKKHTGLTGSPHFLKPDPDADVYVVSYTQLAKAEEVFKVCQFWVTDESQYLKNLDAKRTQYFHSLFYKYTPEYFMMLSGTPMKNRIAETYSFLLLWSHWGVANKITDKYKSFYTFCCRFTNVVQGKYGMSYGGSKNVEELRTYIKPNSIKHEASVLGLPELSEANVIVSYKKDAELEKAFNEFQGKVFGAEIGVKVQSATATAPFTGNYVSEAVDAGEGPIVVFSDHRKPLEILELALSNLRVRKITGETPMQKRQEYIDMFQRGQLDVLLGTYGTLSTGCNLTASNLMVLSDPPWEVASLEQAKKRSHRMGQDRPCRVIKVIGSSVTDLIYKTLEAKTAIIEKVMA
jgi:SNF2 family DNA or RNA helicase